MDAKQKVRTGKVIAHKTDKTAIVAVETLRRHPLYHKMMKKHVKYYVHDEKNETKVGDTVRVVECRPMSHLKRWRLAEIVTRQEVAEVQPKDIT